jgi:hypothetical protein
MDYTPEQLEEKFNLLPENVRQTLNSVHVEERILSIGRAHKLHVDILDEFADETGLVMLGLTHPKNYVAHLSERLGISNDEAVSLAARNIPGVTVLPVEGLNVYDVLRHRNMVVAQEAIGAIVERLEVANG